MLLTEQDKQDLLKYKKDGNIEPDCQDVILNTWLHVCYDPYFIFKILDYFHFLLTDPRIHVIKVAGISPFNQLKYINWRLIFLAVRISSVTLLYKLQNATEKMVHCIPDKCQQPKLN